jgi:NADH-quinone oxidoreductase subunit G
VTDVTLKIDGADVTVPEGTLVIRAAEEAGIEIPRFCDHPLLAPVGACRQCLVDIPDAGNGRGFPKPQASCTIPVAEGMVVETQNSTAVKAQHGTARCATRAASARCRTRRCPTGRVRPGSRA